MPAVLARLVFDHVDLEAALFRPAGVHPQQHLGPVLAFGAARPGVDFDEGVVGVSLAAEQGLDLVRVSPFGQRGQGGDAFVDRRFVAFHFAQFDELDRVGHLARNVVDGTD
jgi:hypothetical protein